MFFRYSLDASFVLLVGSVGNRLQPSWNSTADLSVRQLVLRALITRKWKQCRHRPAVCYFSWVLMAFDERHLAAAGDDF